MNTNLAAGRARAARRGVVAGAAVTSALTRGAARVRVQVPLAGRVSVAVRQGTRVVARGSVRAATPGQGPGQSVRPYLGAAGPLTSIEAGG